MAKIDKSLLPVVAGTRYPAVFAAPCLNRSRVSLGDAAGLTQFGVNLQRLAPGAWSSALAADSCCSIVQGGRAAR